MADVARLSGGPEFLSRPIQLSIQPARTHPNGPSHRCGLSRRRRRLASRGLPRHVTSSALLDVAHPSAKQTNALLFTQLHTAETYKAPGCGKSRGEDVKTSQSPITRTRPHTHRPTHTLFLGKKNQHQKTTCRFSLPDDVFPPTLIITVTLYTRNA